MAIGVLRWATETLRKAHNREARVSAAAEMPDDRPEDIEVVELDRGEYDEAVRAALAELGLTYTQLERQARRGNFSSLRARKLWLAIGEPRGATC
jgi:phosphoribosylanthranilate isomerase